MIVGSVSDIAFKYSHALKTHYLKGELPTVKRGLYGGELNQYNVSLEHLVPKAYPYCGHTTLYNLALATKRNNNKRGTKPLSECLTLEQAESYLDQFRGIHLNDFNGDKYARILGYKFKKMLT